MDAATASGSGIEIDSLTVPGFQEQPATGSTLSQPSVDHVIREHGPYVGRCLRYLGVPERELEDACQEVFLTVHRKLGGFEGRSALRTWLHGVCRFTAREQRRRAARRREQSLEEYECEPVAEPGRVQANAARADDRHLLMRLLDGLDEEKREVIVLYEVEQLSMKEVAELMNCPLQTAYSRLHAARTRMREHAQSLGITGAES